LPDSGGGRPPRSARPLTPAARAAAAAAAIIGAIAANASPPDTYVPLPIPSRDQPPPPPPPPRPASVPADSAEPPGSENTDGKTDERENGSPVTQNEDATAAPEAGGGARRIGRGWKVVQRATESGRLANMQDDISSILALVNQVRICFLQKNCWNIWPKCRILSFLFPSINSQITGIFAFAASTTPPHFSDPQGSSPLPASTRRASAIRHHSSHDRIGCRPVLDSLIHRSLGQRLTHTPGRRHSCCAGQYPGGGCSRRSRPCAVAAPAQGPCRLANAATCRLSSSADRHVAGADLTRSAGWGCSVTWPKSQHLTCSSNAGGCAQPQHLPHAPKSSAPGARMQSGGTDCWWGGLRCSGGAAGLGDAGGRGWGPWRGNEPCGALRGALASNRAAAAKEDNNGRGGMGYVSSTSA
jgi:hypothetical protein